MTRPGGELTTYRVRGGHDRAKTIRADFIRLKPLRFCYNRAMGPCPIGYVVSVSASHTVGREFTSRLGHTKDHHKMVQTASLHGTQCALEKEFGSAA